METKGPDKRTARCRSRLGHHECRSYNDSVGFGDFSFLNRLLQLALSDERARYTGISLAEVMIHKHFYFALQ